MADFNDIPTINLGGEPIVRPTIATIAEKKVDLEEAREKVYGKDEPQNIINRYIDSIINGDELSQFFEIEHLTDRQKDAFLALCSSKLDELLRKHKEEKQALETRITELTNDKELLERDYNNLIEKIEPLNKKVGELTNQIEEKRRELDELLRDGKKDVQEKVAIEEEALKSEMNTKLSSQRGEINSNNEEIYRLESAIREKKAEYAELLQQGKIEVQEEIDRLREEKLKEIGELEKQRQELLNVVESIIQEYHTQTELINNFKKEFGIKEQVMPSSSLGEIKRDIHYQRLALISEAEKNIAEWQLDGFFHRFDEFKEALKSLLPEDVDIDELISKYMGINKEDNNKNNSL